MAEGSKELLALSLQALLVVIFLKDGKFVLIATLLGTLVDSIPVYLNLISFPFTKIYIGVYPVWMSLMWSIFATSFFTSLAWLLKKLPLQFLFGLIGGPLSLYAAFLIGALDFPRGMTLPLIFCSVEWALMVPFLCTIIKKKTRSI